MNQLDRLDYLIDYLIEENQDNITIGPNINETFEEKLKLFRGLCNIRNPEPVRIEFIDIQDAFLTEWNHKRKLTSMKDLSEVQPQLYIWQGDITSLAVDAIVNAANSRLLGCTQANHTCIDNIIHTRAGVQLRLDCHAIIQSQGRQEPAGKAKITEAYNLPTDYVIHTVGPFIDERGVSPLKADLLASCYRSSLQLADTKKLSSIAFCCIGTGEFNFPNEHAAKIAIQTVQDYLQETNSKLKVIFNVFKNEDLHIYQSLLEPENR